RPPECTFSSGRRCCSRGGRGNRRYLLLDWTGRWDALGQARLGNLVDVGSAAHEHFCSLADLRELSHAAETVRERPGSDTRSGAGDLRFCRRADRLYVDSLVAYATSAAGDLWRIWIIGPGSGDAQGIHDQYRGIHMLWRSAVLGALQTRTRTAAVA